MLEKDMPDTKSEAASRGDRIHKLATEMFDGVAFPADAAEDEILVAAGFVARVRELAQGSPIASEILLKSWDPDFFGTADAIVGHTIIDLKTGETWVDEKDNAQLAAYAVMFAYTRLLAPPAEVTAGIDQPSTGIPRFANLTYDELVVWESRFRAAIHEARTAPKIVRGDHCHFCKAKAVCPAQRELAVQAGAKQLAPVATLTTEQRKAVILAADQIRKWLDSVETFVEAETAAGLPTGFELKDGRKKPAAWKDATALPAGWYEKKPLTPAAVVKEKLATQAEVDAISERPAPNKVLSPLNGIAIVGGDW
jgi:hypothetical protein